MRKKECEYNGIKYASKAEMLKSLNIGSTTLKRYMQKGYNETEAIEKSLHTRRKRVYKVNGLKFTSKKDLLEHYRIPDNTFNRYLKKYGSVEEAVNECLLVVGKMDNSRKYDSIVFGIEYNSSRDIAKHFGINYNTFLSRRKRDNLSTEETVKYFIGEKLNVMVLGRKFINIRGMAEELGIVYGTLYHNMSQGYTLDEAVLKGLLRKFNGVKIGENLYNIQCNECNRELFITREELIWFKHDETFCKQRELEV